MTRGRKKDLTIPPSRTLAQQRDYRARRAHYIADLEDRCRRAEEENIQLRRELDETRALLTTPAMLHPETAEASSELMHNLSVASASLAKFQRLAFSNIQSLREQPGLQTSNESPTMQPEYRRASNTAHSTTAIRRNREDRSPAHSLRPSQRPSPPVFPRLTPEIDVECCGGLMDCSHLLERNPDSEDYIIDRDLGSNSKTISRLSGLRSTSDYRVE